MENTMKSLVNECLIEHEGGESFFDAVDEKLRDDEKLINMMIDKVKENEDFYSVKVSPETERCIDEGDYLTLLPHINNCDGFFIAKFIKK